MYLVSYAVRDKKYKYRFDYENKLFEIDVQPVHYSHYDVEHRARVQYFVDVFMDSCCKLKISCFKMWKLK